MFVVKPVALSASYKKLAAIGIWSLIGHTEKSSFCMFNVKIFVLELFSVDAGTTSTISIKEISSLDHKAFNHPVERTTFVSDGFIGFTGFTCAELTEVFSCSWHFVGK